MIISVLIVCTLSALALWQIENIAYLFGANPHILPYTLDYLYILFGFGFIYVLENVLSTFIRNDGNPNLAMIGLIVTALLNILLNYLFIFIFHWECLVPPGQPLFLLGLASVFYSAIFKKEHIKLGQLEVGVAPSQANYVNRFSKFHSRNNGRHLYCLF